LEVLGFTFTLGQNGVATDEVFELVFSPFLDTLGLSNLDIILLKAIFPQRIILNGGGGEEILFVILFWVWVILFFFFFTMGWFLSMFSPESLI
jgi:hypothetical protein